MQVRPRSPTRCTRQADGLTLANFFTRPHQQLAQMRIHRSLPGAMLDKNHIAVAILRARKRHHAVGDGTRRRAGCGRVVHPKMGAPGFQNRVEAHRKTARNPGKLQGGGEEGAPQAIALRRVVRPFFRSVAGIMEPNRLVVLVATDELCA